MKEFKNYHPVVNFSFFLAVIVFSMSLMHPAYVAVSLFGSLIYTFLLKGRRGLGFRVMFLLPVLLGTAIMNPLFNHEGITILAYFPNGNPLTLESILYGVGAASVLVAVICWFSCYNEIMTSDKFIYLFGRIVPSLSLLLSMSLRFVPRFSIQLRKVIKAQRSIGRDVNCGTLYQRMKHGFSILSVMVTWSLEQAIETADSMKSRGYGLPKRSSFFIFTLGKRDKRALLFLGLLIAFLLLALFTGSLHAVYFPKIQVVGWSAKTVFALFIYLLLCIFPIILGALEELKWRL